MSLYQTIIAVEVSTVEMFTVGLPANQVIVGFGRSPKQSRQSAMHQLALLYPARTWLDLIVALTYKGTVEIHRDYWMQHSTNTFACRLWKEGKHQWMNERLRPYLP